MKVTRLLAPVSVNAAADWTKVDTQGWDTTTILVSFGVVAADIDWVLTPKDTNTSAATAGSAVTVNCAWYLSDNDATVAAKFSAAGVLTLTAAADGGRAAMWAYTGTSRYVGVSVASAGGKAGIVGVYAIQTRGRRQPYHTLIAST